jgi:hypothetical protein
MAVPGIATHVLSLAAVGRALSPIVEKSFFESEFISWSRMPVISASALVLTSALTLSS